jgi:hypothetical protein
VVEAMIHTARVTVRRRIPHRASMILVVVMLGGLAWSGSRAEDDRIEPAADPAVGQRRMEGNLIDLGTNFDINVFEQQGGWVLRGGGMVRMGGVGGRVRVTVTGVEAVTESLALARARAQAEKRLDRLDRLCGLSESQRRSLRLALESDIRRLVERVDAERDKYQGVSVNMADAEGQKIWQQFQQDVQRCRRLMLGMFADGSLYAAVLGSTLDADQTARLTAETRTRRTFRWRALVGSVLVKLDDTLGLSTEQHAALERVLLDHEPPLRIDDGARQANAHAEQMLIYLTLSRVDQPKLEAMVTPRQWRALAMLVNQGKAMESWLEQQNLLESEEPDR